MCDILFKKNRIKFSALHVNNEAIKILDIDFFFFFFLCSTVNAQLLCILNVFVHPTFRCLMCPSGSFSELDCLDVHGVVDKFNGPQ